MMKKKKKKKKKKTKRAKKSKEEEKRAHILQFINFAFFRRETNQQKVKQTPLKILTARGARKQPIVIL